MHVGQLIAQQRVVGSRDRRRRQRHDEREGQGAPHRDHFVGSDCSMAAIIVGSSGVVFGENRVIFVPSAEMRNFSKFHRMGPVWPLASVTCVSAA